MAIAFESISSTNAASGTSITLTKPTGLSVGDLMVMCSGFTQTSNLETKSGWTLAPTNGAADASNELNVQYRIADSADVAASNFVFTLSSSAPYAAFLYRISGAVPTSDLLGDSWGDSIENDETPLFTFSDPVTPTFSNSMLIAVMCVNQAATGLSISGVTERGEILANKYLVTGSTTTVSTSDRTTLSATITGASATVDSVAALLSFNALKSATGTTAFLEPNTQFFDPVATCGASVTTELLDINPTFFDSASKIDRTSWTSQAKNTTSWLNQNKS